MPPLSRSGLMTRAYSRYSRNMYASRSSVRQAECQSLQLEGLRTDFSQPSIVRSAQSSARLLRAIPVRWAIRGSYDQRDTQSAIVDLQCHDGEQVRVVHLGRNVREPFGQGARICFVSASAGSSRELTPFGEYCSFDDHAACQFRIAERKSLTYDSPSDVGSESSRRSRQSGVSLAIRRAELKLTSNRYWN